MNNYDDIINLDRPISKHPKMSIEERAAIFSSFDPLEGYNEKIDESNILKEEKIELSEEEKEVINNKIKNNNILYNIIYYDKYKYKSIVGKIKKIDIINKQIILDNKLKILIDNIKEIKDIM